MSMTLESILTVKGQKWLDSFKLTEEETEVFINRVWHPGSYTNGRLSYQCGGGVISTSGLTSLGAVLGTMVAMARNPLERSTLIVATWNDMQEDTTDIFVKAGFSKPSKWVRNPNSGNKIRGSVGVMPAEYVKKYRETRSRW